MGLLLALQQLPLAANVILLGAIHPVHSLIGEQLNLQPSGALGLKRLGFAMDRLARAIVTP